MAIRKIIFLFIIILSFNQISAQDITKASFGKGINFIAADSSMSCKMNLTIQPRITAESDIDDPGFVQGKAMLRRLRLKFTGFAFAPSLKYMVHLGLTNKDMESNRKPDQDNPGVIFDAYLQWEFAKKTSLLFGQYKLPANLSRLWSFTGQSFLERSNAESVFTPYRDVGLQLHNELDISGIILRDILALTQGEGKNRATMSGAYCYSGRLELLPLGSFTNKGDRCEPDHVREQTPKVLLGGAVSYNNDAWRSRSTLGNDLYRSTDITSIMADFLLKYRGATLFAEYYKRDSDFYTTYNDDSTETAIVLAGTGYSAALTYLFPCDISLAARYSNVSPNDEVAEAYYSKHEEIGFGLAKYFSGDQLKIQAELTYIKEEAATGSISEGLAFGFHLVMAL